MLWIMDTMRSTPEQEIYWLAVFDEETKQPNWGMSVQVEYAKLANYTVINCGNDKNDKEQSATFVKTYGDLFLKDGKWNPPVIEEED